MSASRCPSRSSPISPAPQTLGLRFLRSTLALLPSLFHPLPTSSPRPVLSSSRHASPLLHLGYALSVPQQPCASAALACPASPSTSAFHCLIPSCPCSFPPCTFSVLDHSVYCRVLPALGFCNFPISFCCYQSFHVLRGPCPSQPFRCSHPFPRSVWYLSLCSYPCFCTGRPSQPLLGDSPDAHPLIACLLAPPCTPVPPLPFLFSQSPTYVVCLAFFCRHLPSHQLISQQPHCCRTPPSLLPTLVCSASQNPQLLQDPLLLRDAFSILSLFSHRTYSPCGLLPSFGSPHAISCRQVPTWRLFPNLPGVPSSTPSPAPASSASHACFPSTVQDPHASAMPYLVPPLYPAFLLLVEPHGACCPAFLLVR